MVSLMGLAERGVMRTVRQGIRVVLSCGQEAGRPQWSEYLVLASSERF